VRVAYFDCFSGISGDMALGALLDLGLPLAELRAALAGLNLPGWSIDAERGVRAYLSGTRALVHAPEQETHRHLADVRAILAASGLAPRVRDQSLKAFTLLAEAEARVHGTTPDQVHFHEVGALDAIVDIVGVMAGLRLLGVEQVYASPLPLGAGWVRAAHGMLPIPAPATLYLLADAGAPTTPDDFPMELVTPTGAAILAAVAAFQRPALQIERVGYGLGGRDPQGRPNALRVWLGELSETAGRRAATRSEPTASAGSEPGPVLLETNIDNQSPEQLGYVSEQLLALGALDVWAQPIQMKKSRPGVLLAALVPEALEDAAVSLIMRETTTLGVRRRAVERHICEREISVADTPLGAVRVKRKRWRGEDLGLAPEYEDCARIARERGVPLREVYAAALRALS
jgi:pyridinium-3,5-bisthiocarboxylic acid mononucleotide nickel chelatase